MDLDVFYSTLNFFINKATGQYFTPADLDNQADVAQMEVYNEFFVQFLTSNRIDDALAPFYRKFTFTPATSQDGFIDTPADYYHCAALRAIVQDPKGKTKVRGITKINEDELPGVMNSQIVPPTLMDPYYIVGEDWDIQLYPAEPQAGIMAYLARPKKPKYVATTTNRVVTYDANASDQLEWGDAQMLSIMMKMLSSLGISAREQEVYTYAEAKSKGDISSPEKL